MCRSPKITSLQKFLHLIALRKLLRLYHISIFIFCHSIAETRETGCSGILTPLLLPSEYLVNGKFSRPSFLINSSFRFMMVSIIFLIIILKTLSLQIFSIHGLLNFVISFASSLSFISGRISKHLLPYYILHGNLEPLFLFFSIYKIYIYLSVCLPVCLPVCLHACLSDCLSVCLPACLPCCLSACLSN